MPTYDEIFEKVQATLVDALGVDEEDVTRDATLQGDLAPSRSIFWTSSSASSGISGSRSHAASCSPRTWWPIPSGSPTASSPPRASSELEEPAAVRRPDEVCRQSRGRQDRRPLHGRHAGPVCSEQAARPEPGRMSRREMERSFRNRSWPGPGVKYAPIALATLFRLPGTACCLRSRLSTLLFPAVSLSAMRWIWIDKFLEFRSGQFARAIKNLTLAEEHLHDHFPVIRSCPPR